MSSNKVRGAIMATGVAIIAGYGAWFGANLKQDQEISQERQRVKEASVEERVAQIESMRQHLVTKKNELQRKLREVESRIKTKDSSAVSDGS